MYRAEKCTTNTSACYCVHQIEKLQEKKIEKLRTSFNGQNHKKKVLQKLKKTFKKKCKLYFLIGIYMGNSGQPQIEFLKKI